MSLKVLCAGCSSEERERAESDVRRALGTRTDAAQWTVSLVKVAGRWSVTLARPSAGTLTCVAPEGRLAEAIRDALGGPPGRGPTPETPSAPAARPAPSAPARSAMGAGRGASGTRGPQTSRHTCMSCREAFVVICDAAPDEAEETVAVACPHCWHRNYVLVPESAAETRDFTAEKA